jgi:Uma2 family endonuclease
MSVEERARVVEALPADVTWDEMAMPEGDLHSEAKRRALEALRGYFSRQKRRVYLGTELPVRDVEPHLREKWVVSHEGKGLEWVLEVHVGGDRKKDAEYNVRRYARLGIPEYFIYDRARQRLEAFRLPSPEAREYVRMESERGRYTSEVLGLELQVEEGMLRFWAGNALLLESDELIARLSELMEGLQRRVDEEARQLAEEMRLREEEVRRREEAERRLAELRARLEQLEGRQK